MCVDADKTVVDLRKQVSELQTQVTSLAIASCGMMTLIKQFTEVQSLEELQAIIAEAKEKFDIGGNDGRARQADTCNGVHEPARHQANQVL